MTDGWRDDVTLDAWFARAEQGGEFRDVEVMALIRDLKDSRATATTVPVPDHCSTCGMLLLFSARNRGDGMCGRCSRISRGVATSADMETTA